jgi:sugar diacid utilization regulator
VEVRDQSDAGISSVLRHIAKVLEDRDQSEGGKSSTLAKRRLVAAQRLLEGMSSDASSLQYTLDGFHLGLVIAGQDLAAPLQELRKKATSRLLLLEPSDEIHWIWLGGSRQVVLATLNCLLKLTWPPQTAIAYGDPAESLDGWRLTHRQAAAALPLAQQGPDRVVRYTRAALLVTALQDDLLASSLRQAYLAPLEGEPGSGHTAKDTLRAYFQASRHASSAAAALGINRGTVRKRLRTIESRLGATIESVSAELEVALRLDEAAQCVEQSSGSRHIGEAPEGLALETPIVNGYERSVL